MKRYDKLTWFLIIVLLSRTVFAVIAQGIFTFITFLSNQPLTYLESGRWWTVYGSAIDLGCLALLLIVFKKNGGFSFRKVIDVSKTHLKKDLKQAVLILILLLPLTIAWGSLMSTLIFGIVSAPIIAGPLPLWAALYSVLIWPIGWAIMEQVVYIGYCLPKLESIFKSKTIPVFIVMFFWALQHVALPVTLDFEYSLYRFLTVIPMVIIPLIYLKTRRLFPLILVHCIGDMLSAISFYFLPTF